jgi:hypothetical protein
MSSTATLSNGHVTAQISHLGASCAIQMRWELNVDHHCLGVLFDSHPGSASGRDAAGHSSVRSESAMSGDCESMNLVK